MVYVTTRERNKKKYIKIIIINKQKKKENEKKKTKTKTQSPKNWQVFRRPPSFAEPTRNDGHSTPSPQPTTPSTIRILAKREKTEITREREREISEKKIGECSVSPTNPQTDTKRPVTTTRRVPNESTITQGAFCASL